MISKLQNCLKMSNWKWNDGSTKAWHEIKFQKSILWLWKSPAIIENGEGLSV